MLQTSEIENAYKIAKRQYEELEVDVGAALKNLEKISISIHYWQGDDVGGFENGDGLTGDGIQTTGNYPCKARTADELRLDLEKAFSLIPGTHRLNLHAIYAETGDKRVERDELQPEHFGKWVDWTRQNGIGMDFNPTFFPHHKANDGFTLASLDNNTRQFRIDHGVACRKIGEHFGKMLGKHASHISGFPMVIKIHQPIERCTVNSLKNH